MGFFHWEQKYPLMIDFQSVADLFYTVGQTYNLSLQAFDLKIH